MTARSTLASLRKLAAGLAGVEHGIACEGTPVERHTLKSRGKAFLFFGATDAMLKLDESLPRAEALAKKDPTHYRVGKGGWVKITFPDAPPPLKLLASWVAESHALMSRVAPSKKRPPSKRRTPKTR